ncbi:DNA recombination protein RmuC [Patescibacteria group bacterium]|nr:DNA recombination protein RmuC [Patescibacteria group bacterium]MBU1662978.1 DNA recombination protein RmuC [Patescibacteria group bacterium]MBU1933943.1 DNA recombination protein RmuC [Patescibacteria group bacterium]MBU2263813.1 DNA recombination protein RmuC [Patescibacteria group bacterium]
MLNQIIIFLLILLIIGIIAVIILLIKKTAVMPGQDGEKLAAMMERLTQLGEQNRELRQAMDTKLTETHRANQEQIGQTTKIIQNITGQSARLITDVTERLTKLDETNKQVVNFSAQLQNLQDILKNPKQRGVLGEYFLEQTLKNVLPPNSYQMQYPFKDGTIVDAVVFVKEKIIPVDSKFSLENYEKILNCRDTTEREKLEKLFKQDLKLRIDETAKYVKPSENTMDFAFMFIPSEAIYYDLLINKVGAVQVNTRDLIEYAFKEKHVIIVSPTSFLAYLQTVLQGLRALQIEESAKEIRKHVEMLGRHILSYDDFMKKLGVSMSTAVNHYNNAYKEFKKIDKDVVKIAGGESKIEVLAIENPKRE